MALYCRCSKKPITASRTTLIPTYPPIPISGASRPTRGPVSRSIKRNRIPIGNIRLIFVRAQQKIAFVRSFPPCPLNANFF